MSILLEALRKSEKGQRPVEAPTIHSEQHIAVGSEPVKKGLLAVLLLLALLLIAWLVWRQYGSAAVGYEPPVAMPAKKDSAIKTPVSSVQVVDSATHSGELAPGGAPATAATRQPRTPVENFQQASTDPGQPKAGKPKTTGPSTTRPAKVKPQKAKPETRVADAGTGQARTGPSEKSGSKDRADNMRPQPISYWELPDAIRADIPEIKFSVLVYAGEPADRFVLINGQRLAEGDSIQQGLVVEEIRRDGVVFSFRLYQFLVER